MELRKRLERIDWRRASLEIGGFLLVFLLFLLLSGAFNQ